MSYIVGLDFSVLSTGMCIRNIETDEYKFLWFPRIKNGKYPISKKKLKELPSSIEIIPYDIGDIGKLNYIEKQLLHLRASNELGENVYSVIQLLLEKTQEVEIRFEGFSYGSKGKSMLDLVMYQSILRHILWKNKCFNLKFITPSSLKKAFSGKGNANKELMAEKFLEKKPNNKSLFSLKNSLNIKENNLKPYDDLIDSFALTEIETN